MKKIVLLVMGLIVAGCASGAGSPPTSPAVTAVTESADDGQAEVATEAQPTSTGDEASDIAEATVEPQAGPDSAAADNGTEDIDHALLLSSVLNSDGFGPDVFPEIRESGDLRFVAGLVDALRYQWALREDIVYTLNTLTGQKLSDDWGEWVEWAGQHPEIESFDGYVAWKADLFAQIDPDFRRFVYADMKIAPDSRVEEIVWGGVQVDGIPALDNPTMVEPEEADYLIPEERGFGVSINGDTRFYPARFLDWHEMFNDIVGGEPVSLAY